MYTMVLMMAMSGSGDVASFGRDRGGCSGSMAASCHGGGGGGFLGLRNRGGSSCHGSGYSSCSGYGYSGSSCSGSVVASYGSCHGGSSCHGERGGFLGLCKRKSGGSCHGGMASSCHGYTAGSGCSGSMMTTGCTGTIITGGMGGAMAMPVNPIKEGAGAGATTTTKDPNRPLVQWQFERGDHRLTCLVQEAPIPSAYEVAIVPLWNMGWSAVETFDTSTKALHRHAAIAADLREAGWALAAYSA